MQARTVKDRTRFRADFAGHDGNGEDGFLPDIVLGTKGDTISVMDSVVDTILLAAALGLLGWVLGRNPTQILR